jgi:hypothetical protein
MTRLRQMLRHGGGHLGEGKTSSFSVTSSVIRKEVALRM